MYDLEEKRRNYLKLQEKNKYEKDLKIKPKPKFMMAKQIEQEMADSRWTTSKVILFKF